MLKGHVFKNQTFGNQIFALFMNTFLGGHNGIINGYKNSMQVTYSGSSVTVASGALCIQGRFLEEDSSKTLEVGTNTLYCKLVLTIDLDKENTDTDFNQGYYEILVSSTDYPTLTQDDIVNTNSGVYQYELARFKTGLSGISDFSDRRTFLDFDSIYDELEQETTLATKEEVSTLDDTLRTLISTGLAKKLDKTGGEVTGATTFEGGVKINSKGTAGGLELFGSIPYIDFHFGNSNSDYTSRLIEEKNGILSSEGVINFKKGIKFNDSNLFNFLWDTPTLTPIMKVDNTQVPLICTTGQNRMRIGWSTVGGGRLDVYVDNTFVGYIPLNN